MTVSDTFSEWYDRMKSAVTDTVGPGQQKGEDLKRNVRQVMAQGHNREAAYAIANETLKADLEKSERDELLDTAREMSKYDAQIPLTFGNLVEYAGVDVKGEDEMELPKSCRRCDTETRIKGSFMCPDCDPAVNAETDEYELVGSGVQEAKGEDEEETEKADANAAPTRKVYLTPSTVDEAPGDAEVKSDDRGLYYEESVDGVDQKADPMANGHDLDPATGEGTCKSTGETITAETMQDLTDDCPHCGEPLSVIDSKADTEAGETGADLFLVRPGEGEADQYEADILGVGIDFPESGVYIDWHLEAFPDPLEEGHVSEYGSLEDFTKASGNQVELVETVRVPVAQKLASKAVPDNAVSIDSRDEAPGDAQVIEGDRGGLYYVPADGEGGGEGDGGELPTVDLSSAEVTETVSEADDDLFGGSEQQVDRVEANGEEFFVRRMEDEAEMERVGTALSAYEELGVPVPDWGVDPDENAVAMGEVEGNDLLNVDPDQFDDEELEDTLARAALAGDTDLQFENILIDEDGNPYPIDPGEAGQRLEDDPSDALPAWNQLEDMLGEGDMPVTTGEIWDRMSEVADEIDTEELRQSLPDTEAADNIVANIEDAQSRGGGDGGEDDEGADRDLSDVEVGETITIEDDRGNTRDVEVTEVDEEGNVMADTGEHGIRFIDSDEWSLKNKAESDQKAEVPDNAVNIDSRDEAPENAQVIEGDRGGLYYVPADGEEGEDDEAGEVTTEEVGETAAAVTEEFMEKDMAPKPETPADLNNGFCNAVAEAIFEEAGGPEGMEIREAHTMGGRHQWVSYEGKHFDAEATEGVDSYEDLPVWDRFGSPGDAEVVKEGGDDQEEETVEVAGEEVAVGQEVTVGIEGSGSVSGTVDDIVDVDGTPWLMVEGRDSGRINQYSSEDIESVDTE